MNESIIIPYGPESESDYDATYWLLLVQEEQEDDAVTLSDASSAIDATYGLKACQEGAEESTPDATAEADTEDQASDNDRVLSLVDPVSESRPIEAVLQDIANAIGMTTWCKTNEGYYTYLRIYKSHKDEPYQLILDAGEEKETSYVEETVTETLSVENVAGIDLSYAYIGGLLSEFYSCVNSKGEAIDDPKITVDGSSLKFGKAINALLTVSYTTGYDRKKIFMPRTEDGELSEINAMGYYADDIYSLTLNPPEEDPTASVSDALQFCPESITLSIGPEPQNFTCWQTTWHIRYCICRGDETTWATSEEISCSQYYANIRDEYGENTLGRKYDYGSETCYFTHYSDTSAESLEKYTDICHDPDYYRQECCGATPLGGLPDCCSSHYVFKGGFVPSASVMAQYRSEYSGYAVEFKALHPTDGICGWKYVNYAPDTDCCDGVSALEWDSDNSISVIADNSSGIVAVTGGKRPLQVSVRGSGFYLDSNHTFKDGFVDGSAFGIYTGDACGPCKVTVTDGCTTVEHYVRSTTGRWQLLPADTGCPFIADAAVYAMTTRYWVAVSGKYKIAQSAELVFSLGNGTTETFCDQCEPTSPNYIGSCFQGWATSADNCSLNTEISGNCFIQPHECEYLYYLGTHCFNQIKNVYEWRC